MVHVTGMARLRTPCPRLQVAASVAYLGSGAWQVSREVIQVRCFLTSAVVLQRRWAMKQRGRGPVGRVIISNYACRGSIWLPSMSVATWAPLHHPDTLRQHLHCHPMTVRRPRKPTLDQIMLPCVSSRCMSSVTSQRMRWWPRGGAAFHPV